MKILIHVLLFAVAFSVHAKEEDMSFVDVFVQPTFWIGPAGSYTSGDGANQIDEGDFGYLGGGGKVGLKVGPVFLGLDYMTGTPLGDTNQVVSAANRQRYPELDSGTFESLGVAVGLKFSRFYLWTSFLADELEQDLDDPESYTHSYEGSGLRVGLEFDVFKHLNIGLFYHQTTFDQYSSTLSTDTAASADLANEIEATTYGITFSYLIPVSSFAQIQNIFKD